MPRLNRCSSTLLHLADDAPYSMKDFQHARGDVDIEYGPWTPAGEGDALRPFKPPGNGTYGESQDEEVRPPPGAAPETCRCR